MKNQVVVIHGGDVFETYEEYLEDLRNKELDFERLREGKKDWKGTLREALGEKYEVIQPSMPNKQNARYEEWRIWFEKFIPYLQDELVLVGHSMGGIFLVKYLTENEFPKKVLATFLVAAPFDDKDIQEPIGDFKLPEKTDGFKKKVGKVFLYHSEDDPVVPFVDLEKYKKELPDATVRIFKNRGHFTQEELQEIVEDIKSL